VNAFQKADRFGMNEKVFMKGFSMVENNRVWEATSCLGLYGHECLSFKRLREISCIIKRKTTVRKRVVVVLCSVLWFGNVLFGSAVQ
jgi:hypothetical protein